MLSVQGWYEPGEPTNEAQLAVNVLTGTDDHFVYAGTLTVSEPEWDELVSALRSGLKGRLEVAFGPLDRGENGPSKRPKKRAKSAA